MVAEVAGADAPAVSVVVATFRRAARLAELVDALARQEGAGRFEIVIVDDASPDGTWAELERLVATCPVPLRPIRAAANRGPGTARNTGWRAARAPLVAFTDDDCLPQPGWLAALVDGLQGADVVQGRTVPNPQQTGRLGPFSHTVKVLGEGGFYETCNIGYRRDLLERLDGFDEAFRYPYGEDLDLALRAKEAGARTAFRRDAVVFHDVSPSSFVSHLRRQQRVEGVVLVARKHPGLRRGLSMGVFSQPSHPVALLGAAAAVVALSGRPSWTRTAVAGAMAAPYARFRLSTQPLHGTTRQRVAAIPLALAADLVEVAALAAASARLRTLVL